MMEDVQEYCYGTSVERGSARPSSNAENGSRIIAHLTNEVIITPQAEHCRCTDAHLYMTTEVQREGL
jgi:hypothetical protein